MGQVMGGEGVKIFELEAMGNGIPRRDAKTLRKAQRTPGAWENGIPARLELK